MNKKKQITSFGDLKVYQNTYEACLQMMRKLIPKLPANEEYDLISQLSRSSKAIPRLIAEGYAIRHQKSGFRKYLDDAMAECNETVVSICQTRDIYGHLVDISLCENLIDVYDESGRQLYDLSSAWHRFRKDGKNGS